MRRQAPSRLELPVGTGLLHERVPQLAPQPRVFRGRPHGIALRRHKVFAAGARQRGVYCGVILIVCLLQCGKRSSLSCISFVENCVLAILHICLHI